MAPFVRFGRLFGVEFLLFLAILTSEFAAFSSRDAVVAIDVNMFRDISIIT
jgi:hypothetical protein